MKKQKKLSPKILAIVAIASMGTSLTAVTTNSAHADTLNTLKSNSQNEMQTKSILDWKEQIFYALEIVGENEALNMPGACVYNWTDSMGKDGGYYDVEYHQFSVEAEGSPIITNSTNAFVGKTTLTNHTDQEQTLSTNGFEKIVTNSIINSTTSGFNFGVTASAKFSLFSLIETGIEMSTEYNFSDTSSTEKKEEYKYIATPQLIKVPAHSAVEVTVTLDTVKAKGDVNLLTKLSGRDTGHFMYYDIDNQMDKPNKYNLTFHQIIDAASKFGNLKNLSANSDNRTINLVGFGKYEATYGTEFSVTVRPVDKQKTAIKKREVTDEEYTYKIKPKIIKIND
ncbi:sulfurtransferase [Bacillus thuringiensis]|uniref:Sulfurtransferase n=1 Tax=Bacillus thuringiensis TaxID=1428 RepID=A0A9X7BVK7_BACTU|nr:ETX/MTX2 family pore-forming toxin [Bacillus thuringiensis]PGH79707.1 sulfurtransferase [Bacillus thuringiensis]